MHIREALIRDIPQMQAVRHAVKENVLSDPNLVTDQDCEEYITRRGKGWVCEHDSQVVGFAIADPAEHNIWALFLRPEFEKKGIGQQLHDIMLNWYFSQTKIKVWLSTGPNTRAEGFYKRMNWKEVGINGKGEKMFEMRYEDWIRSNT
jgi:GNAT superfamily N-acetyltransferase